METAILVWDVWGRQGHFRQVDLSRGGSYFTPPRTTLAGMVGAILGYDRDDYYDLTHPDRCAITAMPLQPLRRLTMTVNHLHVDHGSSYTKKLIELQGTSAPYTQDQYEMIRSTTGADMGYRIFWQHEDPQVTHDLSDAIHSHRMIYPVSLGNATCLTTQMTWQGLIPASEWVVESPDTPVPIGVPVDVQEVVHWTRTLTLKPQWFEGNRRHPRLATQTDPSEPSTMTTTRLPVLTPRREELTLGTRLVWGTRKEHEACLIRLGLA